jgi:hypothetical protein
MDADLHAFYAGLANLDKGWCTMDCRRTCDDRVSCDVVKTFCNRDVVKVREFAERWLREQREETE